MVIKKVKPINPVPRGLTTRNKLIYEDSGGNKLFAKKGQGVGAGVQWCAHNAQGRIVNHQGATTLIRRWKRSR